MLISAADSARRDSAASPGRSRHVAFGVGMFALTAALLLNSALGPLGFDVVDYPISDSLQSQLIGLEIVTVFLVAPLSFAGSLLAIRGHRAAGIVAFGPAAYAAYMFFQYVLGPEYPTFNAIVLFDVVVFAAGLFLAIWAWAIVEPRSVPKLPPIPRRRYAAILLGLAAFVVSRYLGPIFGGPIPADFANERSFYWSIVSLDLGIVVPGTVVAAFALFRGTSDGHKALYAVLGWFALVPPSVASMAIVMVVNSDPAGSIGQAIFLGVIALAFDAFAVVAFRPLFRPVHFQAIGP
jgi:hypothetical protein